MYDIDNKKFSIAKFYERRARRILPVLYFLLIAITPFCFYFLLPSDLKSFSESLIAIPLFLSNILFWKERGYFAGAIDLKPLIHTWSLAVEEQFYIIFPIILLLLTKKRRLLYAVLATVFSVSLFASYYVTLLHFDTAFYMPFTRAWELLSGAGCALFLYKRNSNHIQSTVYSQINSIIGLTLIVYADYFFDSNTIFPGISAIIPVAGSVLLIIYASPANFVGQILSWNLFVTIGLISYSLYLWHQPVFALLRYTMPEIVGVKIFICAIVFIFILSFCSWYFIENPFRKKGFLNRKTILIMSVSFGLFIVAVGITGVINNGFSGRYTGNDQNILMQFSAGSDYNQARFNSLNLKEFSLDRRKKVLLVGDSFAKDLLNIMIDGGLDKDIEFSTKQINSECGNLFLDEDFSANIPENRIMRCKVIGYYESKKMNDLMLTADEIWLCSDWKMWVAKLLPKSVKNIQQKYGKKVMVFGLKNFGHITQKSAISISLGDRPKYVQKIDSSVSTINDYMRKTLKSNVFVDVIDLLSKDHSNTRVYTDKGMLISFDGSHVTKEGAVYVAQKLYGHLK